MEQYGDETMLRGERTSDAGLTLIVLAPREDEMIVGTCRLTRVGVVAGGDLVEGMNRNGAVPSDGSRSA